MRRQRYRVHMQWRLAGGGDHPKSTLNFTPEKHETTKVSRAIPAESRGRSRPTEVDAQLQTVHTSPTSERHERQPRCREHIQWRLAGGRVSSHWPRPRRRRGRRPRGQRRQPRSAAPAAASAGRRPASRTPAASGTSRAAAGASRPRRSPPPSVRPLQHSREERYTRRPSLQSFQSIMAPIELSPASKSGRWNRWWSTLASSRWAVTLACTARHSVSVRPSEKAPALPVHRKPKRFHRKNSSATTLPRRRIRGIWPDEVYDQMRGIWSD